MDEKQYIALLLPFHSLILAETTPIPNTQPPTVSEHSTFAKEFCSTGWKHDHFFEMASTGSPDGRMINPSLIASSDHQLKLEEVGS